MPETAIGLMAKYPEAGKVKTRLAATIGEKAALEIYGELLQDTCELVTGLGGADFYRAVFVTPDLRVEAFESRYQGFDTYQKQEGGDLGQRMQAAFENLLDVPRVSRAMLVGADCPELGPELIVTAAEFLRQNDVVLGPSHDGGYYLIGMNVVQNALFGGIAWSTAAVFDETVAAAEAAGLAVGQLPVLRDLDDGEDLRYFSRKGLVEGRKAE